MKKFIIFFLSVLIFSISIIGSLNFIYDDIYFADILSKKISIETENRRVVTPLIVKKYKPECVIIGTSRIGRGISSKNDFIKKNKCLNLYFNAANIDELNLVIKLLIRSNVKKVIIGLDFFSFNKNFEIAKYQGNLNKFDYTVDNFLLRLFFNFERLISLRNLKKIFINNQIAKKEIEVELDSFYESTFDVTNYKRLDVSLVDDRYMKSKELHSYLKLENKGHAIGNFNLNDNGLKDFTKLIKELDEKNIETRLFFSPIHSYLLEGILLTNKENYFKILSQIASNSNLNNIYIYYFSEFNQITSGVNNSKNFVNGFYFDLGHYSSEVGDMIINKMFLDQSSKFGSKISNFNIHQFEKKINENRLNWQKEYSKDFQIINKILECDNNTCIEEAVLKAFKLSNNIKKIKFNTFKNTKDEIYIPSGYFHFGLKEHHRTINDSEYEFKYLDDFYIDKYEVSNEEFINKSKNEQLKDKLKKFNKKLPVTGISYFEAEKFCEENGKRLPSEEEWEKALKFKYYSRYPWGNSFPSCNKINFNGEKGIGCGQKIRKQDITDHGNLTIETNQLKKGNSILGVYNLSGNVWEFVKSNNNDAISKGGSWSSELIRVHSASRYILSKDASFGHVGFRCARN